MSSNLIGLVIAALGTILTVAPATSLSSHPELVEGPAASDAQRADSLEPVPTKAR
jgi:hypothetical protein